MRLSIVIATMLTIAMAQPLLSEVAKSPVVDYSPSAKRRSGAAEKVRPDRYNGQPTRVSEVPKGVQALPIFNHWQQGLSALPVSASDVVVIGRVRDAQAFLSADGTGVYSTFSINVERTFKPKFLTLLI